MEFWGDGAGAAQALTAVYVNGSVISVDTENFLHCQATLSFDATVATDIRAQLSFDAGQTWRTYDIVPIVAMRGDETQHNFIIRTPVKCQVRIALRRRGGTVDSSAFVEVYLREHSGDLDETRPLVTNRAEAYSDGAEAAETLTGAFVYGDYFDLGDADTLELMVTKSTVNDPTNVDLHILTSDNAGTTGYDPTQIDSIAGGFDYRSSTIKRITDFGAGNPETKSVVIEGLTPGSWVSVGARFVGGVAPDLLVYGLCHRT